MSGLLGRKIRNDQLVRRKREKYSCTVIEAGPCVVTQVRTEEVDGYNALQLGFDDKKGKSSTALDGHLKSWHHRKKKSCRIPRVWTRAGKLGDSITVNHFEEGEFVDVSGVSKGKDFKGL